MSTTPQPRTEPTKMTRLVIGIQPRHHRHTPTNSGHPPRSAQRAGDTHPRNKSTLAHYRVLKQHQHTHQPDHHSPASQAASLQATHNINQKSNSRSTTVYPAVTLCSFSIPPDQPLGPLRSNGWIYNHEPQTNTNTQAEHGFCLGVIRVAGAVIRVLLRRSFSCLAAGPATHRGGNRSPPGTTPRLRCARCSRRRHLP